MKVVKFTIFLVFINTLYYILHELGFIGYYGLVRINGAIRDLWTIVAYSITHIRFEHYFYNMLFIIGLVGFYEYKFGTKRTIVLYYTTTIIGVLVILYFKTNQLLIAHGASVGWYAMLGAFIVNWKNINKFAWIGIVILTVMCFYDTFTSANVSKFGHMGGFFSGIVIEFAIIQIRTLKLKDKIDILYIDK